MNLGRAGSMSGGRPSQRATPRWQNTVMSPPLHEIAVAQTHGHCRGEAGRRSAHEAARLVSL